MKRGIFAPVVSLARNAARIWTIFPRQRLGKGMLLAFLLLAFSVVFAFLAFAPVLSPFVYPLF